MAALGVVTGLKTESDCLAAFSQAGQLRVRCAGARPQAALDAARSLLAEGCHGLLSFGLAGGLAADVRPGALIISDAVVAPDGTRFAADRAWHGRLMDVLAGDQAFADEQEMRTGIIAGVNRPVGSPAEKQALARARGAVACDMESHMIAAAALAAGAPFVVVRAIADATAVTVPDWLEGAIQPDGRARIGVVLAGLCRHPRELALLLRLARDSGRGLAALRRLALRVGPRFCFDAGGEMTDQPLEHVLGRPLGG